MYEEKKKSEKNFLEIKFESIENSLFIYSISFWFLKNFFNRFICKFYLKNELRIKKMED